MRTTVTLDDDTAAIVRQRMQERGLSFKEALNDAIRAGERRADAAPFRTRTVALGIPGVGLDKALALADAVEDEELLRKMRTGK